MFTGDIHSVHPPLMLEGELEFWFLWGGQNIFDLSCSMRGRGLYFFGGTQFILRLFSHFEMQDFKNSKSFACALIFNIHIFRFKIHAGIQVDIDFNTESKSPCSKSSFFSPLSGHSKPNKPMKVLSFLSIWCVKRALQSIRLVKLEHFV